MTTGPAEPLPACEVPADDTAERTTAVIGRLLEGAAACEASGRPDTALRLLLGARRRLSFVPLSILDRTIALCRQMGREQVAAEESLAFAGDCFSMGYPDLGLEAVSAALVLDGLGTLAITRSASRLRGIAEWYEPVAAAAGGRTPAPVRSRAGPLRIAIVVPSLVDHVVAYTKSVLALARHADPSRFAVGVYVSESLVCRERPMFPFGCIGDPTPILGACAVRQLREGGVPVVICPRDLRYREAGLWLARRLDADGVDAVLAITGMACPIDWIALRLCAAPVRAAMHIGSSLFMPGLDVTYYDNPANVAREDGVWADAFGARVVMPLGTDLDVLEGQPSLSRRALGIPDDAVVIGTMSNHLLRRMGPEYLEVIAGALSRHPQAWFLGVGADRVPAAESVFHARGVAARVRFLGRQPQAGRALKVFDVYANEFPVGGSKSVMEAMACGVPVMALRWSDAHAECAGAEIVGAGMAVEGPDVAAYGARLDALVANAELRGAAGEQCRRRARERYAVAQGVQNLLGDLKARHDARCAGAAGTEGRVDAA